MDRRDTASPDQGSLSEEQPQKQSVSPSLSPSSLSQQPDQHLPHVSSSTTPVPSSTRPTGSPSLSQPWRPVLDPWQEKKTQIRAACTAHDVARLRELAVADGGLITDEIRRQAWPLLLGCSIQTASATLKADGRIQEKAAPGSAADRTEPADEHVESWRSLPPHRDEDQVKLDVDRSFIYYPNNVPQQELDRRKVELSALITEVLRRQPYLCYFQGYHDICQVFLLVLDPPQHYDAVSRLSVLRIRDFMLPNLTPALAQLRLIPAILKAANPALHDHLSQTQPFFALSGTLTMYAHDIQTYGDIARLFDALLARDAVFSVYLFAQIVLSRADELFETPETEPEILHSILSKLPQPLALESLLASTVELCAKYPPESLAAWRAIPSSSVLKTTRLPLFANEASRSSDAAMQTMEQGERFFEAQVRALQWAEQKEKMRALAWKYRRPARAVGTAVLVAVISYYLRKSDSAQALLRALWELLPRGLRW